MGYKQLEIISQVLTQSSSTCTENTWLREVHSQVERTLFKNRTLAEDLANAHQLLVQVAQGLHYPPDPLSDQKVTGEQVAQDIQHLIEETKPSGRVQKAQIRLLSTLRKRWQLFGQDLLHCYTIPGVPPDNLQIESLFGHLRRHQRRISGRSSTRELEILGQAQVLFSAHSKGQLLQVIQAVPYVAYQAYRQRLAETELPQQFFRRLHHDPEATITTLVQALTACHPNPTMAQPSTTIKPIDHTI
jgi:hypothetical protein